MRFTPVLLLVALTISFVAQAKDPDVIFKKTINGILYLYNHVDDGVSMGSGVLIDKSRSLFITNAHVVKDEQTLGTYFPAWDSKGRLIVERAHYESSTSEDGEKNLRGRGRLAAISKVKDLAILYTDKIPKTATEIEILDDTISNKNKKGDKIHILGNPAGRDLWQWSMASFDRIFQHSGNEHNFKAVATYGTAYFGNSGGAMLDDEGRLVGVTQSISGDGLTKTYGVHVDEIRSLLASIDRYAVFTIKNNSGGFLDYTLKDCHLDDDEDSDSEWLEEYNIALEGDTDTYACDGSLPKIEYSHYVDGKRVKTTFDVEVSEVYLGDGVEADPAYDGVHYEFKRDEKFYHKIVRVEE